MKSSQIILSSNNNNNKSFFFSNLIGMLRRQRLRFVVLTGTAALVSVWLLVHLASQWRPHANSDLINLNELYHVGDCLLREAGKEIVRIRGSSNGDEKFGMRMKADASVVTRADVRSHTIIVHTLESLFPGLTINSEENEGELSDEELRHYVTKCGTHTFTRSDSDLLASLHDVNVWVDPLDATQEYSGNKNNNNNKFVIHNISR